MHKTGSSSIQASLNDHLSDNRFYYPKLGRNHSRLLATVFMEHPEQYHLNRKRGLAESEVSLLKEKYKRNLRAEISNANDRTILLSAEDLPNLPPSGLSALREFLIARGHEVQAVAYIR